MREVRQEARNGKGNPPLSTVRVGGVLLCEAGCWVSLSHAILWDSKGACEALGAGVV